MTIKQFRSDNYNYDFDNETGLFVRWGKTKKDDPERAPFPEILDIEISTICHGVPPIGSIIPVPCSFCYHGCSGKGKLMSLETFQDIMSSMNTALTQCALGIGDIGAPNTIPILKHARSIGVVPNLTTNGYGVDDDMAKELASLVGGIAVSRYANKNICYDAVKNLTDAGIVQTNIHMMISEETFDQTMETLTDILTDERLKKMNAIVFLALKKKGRAVKGFNTLSKDKYKIMMDFAVANKIKFGMDTCNNARFNEYLDESIHPDKEKMRFFIEKCCAGSFSSFISVDGIYYPCSFMEKSGEWVDGLNVLEYDSFDEIWNHPKTLKFGCEARSCKNGCPYFDV